MESRQYTAFHHDRILAAGAIPDLVAEIKEKLGRPEAESLLVFDDASGELLDIDLRGEVKEILERLEKREPRFEPEAPRGPGRPRLGVVAREVTLLPRHWEWLNSQPGGASVALRKLVDEARKANGKKDRVRFAREGAYRFLSALAGNRQGYEEAIRALFASNQEKFESSMASWPEEIRAYALALGREAFV